MASLLALAWLASDALWVNGASPWAADACESAFCVVETALGRYSSGLLVESVPSAESSEAGRLLRYRTTLMSGLMVALSWIRSLVFLLLVLGFFAHQSVNFWSDRQWGHVDLIRPEGDVQSCGGFRCVPGPLQSVQRAEMWGVILA